MGLDPDLKRELAGLVVKMSQSEATDILEAYDAGVRVASIDGVGLMLVNSFQSDRANLHMVDKKVHRITWG